MTVRSFRLDDDAGFNPRAFALWCQKRWRFCTLASVIAVLVSFAVSIALPKQYTATATVLIGAPAGNDPRATTAMNSVYLDSLKAWERVAASDFIFAQALDTVRGGNGDPAGSVASLKKQILKVNKPAGMAFLEISVTLPDGRKAQKMAQIIAEQTIAQSRSSDETAAADLNSAFREQSEAAVARVANAAKTRDTLAKSSPVDVVQSELGATSQLSARLQAEIALARAELAGDRSLGDSEQLSAVQARLASLEKEQRDTTIRLATSAGRLEVARNLRETADAELRAARAALETANQRMNEAMSAAKFRGERLRLVDPGVVPKEPSSPSVLLNVFAALFVSLGGCLLYLAVSFGLRRDVRATTAERQYSQR